MSTLPAVPEPAGLGIEGLEDFDETDLQGIVPRIKLVHEEAVFKDDLTGETFTSLDDVVVLGLVKHRTLWDTKITEGGEPFCRSLDAKTGHPGKAFPWKASGFKLADQADPEHPELPCETCLLKEWGSHPTRENVPWCNLQQTLVVLHEGTPALLRFQGSGIKPCTRYALSFTRQRQPMFTYHTSITLTAKRTGTVNYAVPTFTRGAATDPADHDAYAAAYRRVRAFLQTPRRRDEEEEEEEAPTSAAAKVAAKGKAAPVAEAPFDEDEDF